MTRLKQNFTVKFLLMGMGLWLLVALVTTSVTYLLTPHDSIENMQITLPVREIEMNTTVQKFQSFTLPSGETVVTRHIVVVDAVSPVSFWVNVEQKNIPGYQLTIHLSTGDTIQLQARDKASLIEVREQLLASIENAY